MSVARSRGFGARRLAACALFAALIAICSQIQIPLPAVPVNLALFAVHLAGALLGARLGALSAAVYALLGLIGVPVFAGFRAGPAALFGRTGGYILGYLPAAALAGLLGRRGTPSFRRLCLSMAAGTAVCYAFGTVWFMALSGVGPGRALTLCVLPFLPGDAVKIALAALLSLRLHEPLRRLGFAL